jgi:hypothetical protein
MTTKLSVVMLDGRKLCCYHQAAFTITYTEYNCTKWLKQNERRA